MPCRWLLFFPLLFGTYARGEFTIDVAHLTTKEARLH